MTNNSNEIRNSFSLNSNGNDSSDNCICFGPIRFYRRKRPAPTLSTGRKSKFEELEGDEYIKRQLRREKNRLLSKKLKEKRDNIHNELIEQINQLEEKHSNLSNYIQQLQSYKNNLSHKLENFNQDPLTDLMNSNEYCLFFDQSDLEDFDSDSLFTIFSDEQSSIDDLLSDESQ